MAGLGERVSSLVPLLIATVFFVSSGPGTASSQASGEEAVSAIRVEGALYDDEESILRFSILNDHTHGLTAWGIRIFVSHPNGTTQEIVETVDRLPRLLRTSSEHRSVLQPGERFEYEVPIRLVGVDPDLGGFSLEPLYAIDSQAEAQGDLSALEEALAVRRGWLDAAKLFEGMISRGADLRTGVQSRLDAVSSTLEEDPVHSRSKERLRLFHERASLLELLERYEHDPALLISELPDEVALARRHTPKTVDSL